jgi:hypothetical protein
MKHKRDDCPQLEKLRVLRNQSRLIGWEPQRTLPVSSKLFLTASMKLRLGVLSSCYPGACGACGACGERLQINVLEFFPDPCIWNGPVGPGGVSSWDPAAAASVHCLASSNFSGANNLAAGLVHRPGDTVPSESPMVPPKHLDPRSAWMFNLPHPQFEILLTMAISLTACVWGAGWRRSCKS